MFKRKIMFLSLLAFGFTGTLFASGNKDLGNGEISTVVHTPPAFDALYIHANADVTVHLSDIPRVVISASPNMHDRIRLRSRKNELQICVRGNEKKAPRFAIDVYTPSLSGLGVGFDSRLTFANGITRNGFMLGLAGRAEISGIVECETIEINMVGEGRIHLTGSAGTANINLVGDGIVDIQNLRSTNTNAYIVGTGNILTWTSDNLTVTGVGNGTISYHGHPIIDITAVGTNRIIKLPDNL